MTQLRDTWQTMRAADRPDDGARLQLVDASDAVRVFAALVGRQGALGMMVEFPERPRRLSSQSLSSRAFKVQSTELESLAPGHSGVLITLTDPQFEDLFYRLTAEAADAVMCAPTTTDAVGGLRRVIDRWRRFVERRRGPLTEERIRGLMGELTVLLGVVRRLGARAAVESWTGPDDALRDFALPSESLEIKTFHSESGGKIRISSPQQLDVVETRPVYLIAVQLERSVESGRTLSDLVMEAMGAVSLDPEAGDLLEQKLADYGYMAAHGELYTQRYVVERQVAFRITPEFPRIAAADVPAEVHDVRFSLMIAELSRFAVDPERVLEGLESRFPGDTHA